MSIAKGRAIMNASEPNPQDHSMYQRWRAKNPPKADPAEQPPVTDEDSKP